MNKFVFFLLMSLLSFNGYAASLSVETLLEKMVKVYGGEHALKKADNCEQMWDITAIASGEQGVDSRKISLPDGLYTDISYPSRSETRILKAGEGVKITNRTNRRIAKGPMLDAMKLQLMRLYTPLTLKYNSKALQLRSENEHYILTLSQGSISSDYYVDSKTFYIVKVVGTLTMGKHSMSFVTLYSEHKRVEGVLMHHHENKYAGSVNTAVLDLKGVRFSTGEAHHSVQNPTKI